MYKLMFYVMTYVRLAFLGNSLTAIYYSSEKNSIFKIQASVLVKAKLLLCL